MKPVSLSVASHNASSAWRVTRLHLPSRQTELALQFKHWTAPDELILRALSTLCHASLNFSSLMQIVHHLSLKMSAHFAPLCAPSVKTAPLARSTVSNPMHKNKNKKHYWWFWSHSFVNIYCNCSIKKICKTAAMCICS